MSIALALKYRPKTFDDLSEQTAVVKILTNQIETNTIKHGYLFSGSAGCGKTTAARIFANMINNGKGEPIELDAASNNSVDDIRTITEQAQTKSLDSEYKVFIIDEVHSLSNQAFQAFLKTLEEPPAKSIFILATTNPEKIPATILSRVQRYNFQKISFDGVVKRLQYILDREGLTCESTAPIELIAKLADGGMRDAITLMDECLSYSTTLTEQSVVDALGVVNYSQLFSLTDAVVNKNKEEEVNLINIIYSSGIDLKQFIKDYFRFILDLNVYYITKDFSEIKIPKLYRDRIEAYTKENRSMIFDLLEMLTTLQSSIKWESDTKSIIIANFLLFTVKETK